MRALLWFEQPAARSAIEVAIYYPGVHTGQRSPYQPLAMATRPQAGGPNSFGPDRSVTGVDIHPAAILGEGLFIDHATGVVIGETAEVGVDVTLYQGVTLGGTSLDRSKRHPTVGDRVTIGAGAKILGAITIGHDSRIGANAAVVKPLPANSVVVGVPGQIIARSRPRAPTAPPGLDETLMPDLVGSSLRSLLSRVDQLETAVNGRANHRDARPSETGVWSGEDFSI